MTFYYTRHASNGEHFHSSAVDELWYNENDQTLVIEWTDSYDRYRYDNVSVDEYEDLTRGNSVGRAVAALKTAKGPGEELDEFDRPKETTVVEKATTEISLKTPEVNEGSVNVSDDWTWTLTYDLDGKDRTFTFNGSNLTTALDSLDETAAKLGLDITVKRAEVVFV